MVDKSSSGLQLIRREHISMDTVEPRHVDSLVDFLGAIVDLFEQQTTRLNQRVKLLICISPLLRRDLFKMKKIGQSENSFGLKARLVCTVWYTHGRDYALNDEDLFFIFYFFNMPNLTEKGKTELLLSIQK